MALESVFANPPPLVGVGNKETLKHGEKESSHEEASESDGEGPPILIPADAEEGEIEEGEIIDSGEEAPQLINEATRELSADGANDDGTVDELMFSNKRKRKKKKKKKKLLLNEGDLDASSQHSNGPYEEKIKKPKRKHYIDHDKVEDDEPWFQRSPSHKHDSPDRSPSGSYENLSNCENERRDGEGRHFGEHRGPNSTNPNLRERRESSGKKRKGNNSHFSGDRKRSRMNRSGMMSKNSRGRRDQHQRPLCKFYLDGKCAKGSGCAFIHEGNPARKMELCKFYLNGFCTKGDNCLFMHKEFPCKFFHTGKKCFSADQCKFSHDPINDDLRKVLDKHLESNDEDAPPSPPPPPPPSSKESRPSLLGSPPRHIKEMAESMRKIPSLFDIDVRAPSNQSAAPPPPPPPQSMASPPPIMPPKPNFYTDSMKISPVRPPLLPFPPVSRLPMQRPNFSPPSENDRSPSHASDHPENEIKELHQSCNKFEMSSCKDVDMRMMIEEPEVKETNKFSEDESGKSKQDKGNSSESESETKRPISSVIPIPSHLPKKQRELFLRIQQQQREAESSQEDSDRNDAKKEDVNKEENWYSSDEDDDDDDNDQPLTAVLKKLQQQPPKEKNENQKQTEPVFDIAKMLGMIRSKATSNFADKEKQAAQDSMNKEPLEDKDMRMKTRDPRMRKAPRNVLKDQDIRFETRGMQDSFKERSPRLDSKLSEGVSERTMDTKSLPNSMMDAAYSDPWGNGDKDMRRFDFGLTPPPPPPPNANVCPENSFPINSVPYRLKAMNVSQPNYSTLTVFKHNDPRLQNDPRLKKQTVNLDPKNLSKNVFIASANNHEPNKHADPLPNGLHSGNHQDALTIQEAPIATENVVLKPPPRRDPRSGAAKADPRIERKDPRLAKAQPVVVPNAIPEENSGNVRRPPPAAATVGRHLGLPIIPSPRERTAPLSAVKEFNRTPAPEPSSNDSQCVKKTPAKVDSEDPVDEAEVPSKDSTTKLKGGSYTRKSSLDYASPLEFGNNLESSTTTRYNNSYNRRPHANTFNNPPVSAKDKPSPVLNSHDSLERELQETDFNVSQVNTSLKDVFKTIDPTASPFC